jgi:trehalose 6-phosphate phosphatase
MTVPPEGGAAGEKPPPLEPESALFIDVDGTLLEIAPQPELVVASPELPVLLQRLAGMREGALALVSGRPIAQLDNLFRPWRGAAAGMHGAERRLADGSVAAQSDDPADRAAAAAIERLRPVLSDFARRRAGLRLEDKGRTLAIHYRAAPQAGEEVHQIVGRLTQESGSLLRIIAGKMVVEVQPRHHGKDRAIAAFMAESPFRGRRPVFLGDDTTDEDGFAEVNRRDGIAIRIGAPKLTAARYALPSVADALAWLMAAAAAGITG